MNLVNYIQLQIAWSSKTFGERKSGGRSEGILKHIESEIQEIRDAPTDLKEWVDIMILALDGAWRAGYTPQEICDALEEKQTINFAREWPDPSTLRDDEPSFHKKETTNEA